VQSAALEVESSEVAIKKTPAPVNAAPTNALSQRFVPDPSGDNWEFGPGVRGASSTLAGDRDQEASLSSLVREPSGLYLSMTGRENPTDDACKELLPKALVSAVGFS